MSYITAQTNRPIEGRVSSSLKFGLMVIAGMAVMTLSAKTQAPFWPVPMTLHTMAVMAFAVLFGPHGSPERGMLTTPNADMGEDAALFEAIGRPVESHAGRVPVTAT